MAMFALRGGIFGVQTATRSARLERGWLRRVPSHVVVGLAGVLAIAGMFGAVGQMAAGGTLWPGMAAALVGIGVGVLSCAPHTLPRGTTACQLHRSSDTPLACSSCGGRSGC
jgi:hypothetical protein